MKKFNKKNIIIILLSLVVLAFIIFYLYGYKIELLIHEWQHPQEQMYADEETAGELATAVEYYGHPEADAADAAYSCDGLYFYGDTGYLIKGALLDQSVAPAYKNLPDTIAIIRYGEQVDQLDEKGIDFYNKKARFSPHKKFSDNNALTAYLNMAEKGQVEFLRFLPNKQGDLELEDQCDFRSRHGDYFDPNVTWQRDIPLPIKEVLVNYFKSDEGGNYRFVNDRRALNNVFCTGTFTGMDQYTQLPNKEIALVLSEKNNEGNNRERILVVGYDDKHHKGYILYNEVFYTKLLIKRHNDPYTLPEEAVALAKYISPNHQIIEVKTDSNERLYLYYEKEFDTMNRKQFGVNEVREGDCGGC